MSGASKTRLHNIFAKLDCYNFTMDPEDWIDELELLRGKLQKLGSIIDNVEMMTHIMSKLPGKYENIAENLDNESDNKIDMVTIEII